VHWIEIDRPEVGLRMSNPGNRWSEVRSKADRRPSAASPARTALPAAHFERTWS